MHHRIKIIIIILAVLSSVLIVSDVNAKGTETGNGGQAFVCRDFYGAVVTSHLRDFYESSDNLVFNQRYYEASRSKKTTNDWLYEIFKKFPDLKTSLWNVKQDYRKIRDERLDITHSLFPVFKNAYDSGDMDDLFRFDLGFPALNSEPKSKYNAGTNTFCRYEYFGFRAYDDLKKRYVYLLKVEIIEKMSPLDQAGAFVHEAGWSKYSSIFKNLPPSMYFKTKVVSTPLRAWVREAFFGKFLSE